MRYVLPVLWKTYFHTVGPMVRRARRVCVWREDCLTAEIAALIPAVKFCSANSLHACRGLFAGAKSSV